MPADPLIRQNTPPGNNPRDERDEYPGKRRPGVPEGGPKLRSGREHLYVRRADSKRAINGFRRELHVCRSLKPAGGVHIAVTLDHMDNPAPGAEGHQRQIGAGINVTKKQARQIIRQMESILDA